ncbi:hypothetical protein J437_LFUL000494, partial [Ladona fulva]
MKMAAIKRKRVLHNTKIIEDAIAEEINLFDEEVNSLKMSKSKLEFDLKYLECYTITLQEELLIIKEFEAQEDILTAKVQDKLLEKNKMIEKIHDIEGKIEARKQKVEDLEDQQNNIIANFDSAVTNSSASLVLKKIFKKKYKPPKIKAENDSSEEESSSSESSTDTSYEGDEFVLPVKIDETICPEGCAPELFELTLNLRSQRHKVEEEIKEEKEQLDMLKKDLEMSNKNLKSIENAHQKCDEELGVVLHQLRMKQNKLTEVIAANTEKKSLLAALQEENTKLDKYLKNQAELSNSPLE